MSEVIKSICAIKERAMFLAAVAAIFTLIIGASMLLASDGKLLADKHKKAGIECNSCHKETPPKQAVKADVCTGCHGDYEKLAKSSEKVEPNPHDSHEGNLDCGVCHHSHRESEFYCSRCHAFGLKVP
jgi:hypothetical protein